MIDQRHVPAVLLLIVLTASSSPAAEPMLAIPAAKDALHLAIPLPEKSAADAPGLWRLVDADGKESAVAQAIPALAADGTAGPRGRIAAALPAGEARRLRLVRAGDTASEGPFAFAEQGKTSLELREAGKPVLTYNYGVITNDRVPETDARRSRACYVHPVWGLSGEILTDDFPKDHYHHHGIFWTWPHVKIGDVQYDLWSDHGGIHQRFVRWLARETGPVCAVLGVENGWFVGDRKVMIERVWLRAYRRTDDQRALDIELTFIPQDRPITLRGAEGKSYGGLTVRFIPGDRKETLITVPSGPAKDDLPDTPLAWADFTSRFGTAAGRSGAAVFVHPGHPDFPPTWLTRYYGPLCVGWPGVKDRTFEPGVPIRLNYRLWIHKSAADPSRLHAAYGAYQATVATKWTP